MPLGCKSSDHIKVFGGGVNARGKILRAAVEEKPYLLTEKKTLFTN
jgi:hypothetical protein